MRSVPSLPSGTFSQAPCPSIWCTQSSSRSRSSPRRSPVARVSSSASACSRASGLGPDADRCSSATASRRSASGRQVAGQRVRGVGDVPGEHQRPGRGGGPAPLGDVGEELADGEDLPASVPDRDAARPSGCRAAASEASQGSMCARRSSAARSVTGGSQAGQEAAEPGQVAGDRLDGGRGAGGGGLRAVVEQQPAQRFGDPAVVPAQPGPPARIGGGWCQHAEVEQHPVRGADQRRGRWPSCWRCPSPRRSRGTPRSVPPGRPRSARRAAARSGSAAAATTRSAARLITWLAVVQVGGRRGEPGEVAGERAAPSRGEQPADLAVGQVVVARSAAGRCSIR